MRVVSLLPSATEIVAALGAGDSLVGVTHECDYPPAAAALPRVTTSIVDAAASPGDVDAQVRMLASAGSALYLLDEPRIRELQPELIFTQALCDVCAVSETDVRALAARMIPAPRVVSLSASTLDDVLADVTRVANALRLDDAGRTLLAGMQARIRAVHDTLKAAHAPRPRIAVIEWGDPVFSAGHWVPEMVKRAGGIDVLAAPGAHSRVISAGEIAAASPEIVIVAPCGYDVTRAAGEARRLLATPEWQFPGTTAVWALDGNALTSRPGPRLVDGIEVMAHIFNPALFPPVDPRCAVRVSSSARDVPPPAPGAPRTNASASSR
jgi:iron complex transport system substrate-binding protein